MEKASTFYPSQPQAQAQQHFDSRACIAILCNRICLFVLLLDVLMVDALVFRINFRNDNTDTLKLLPLNSNDVWVFSGS